MIRRSFSYRRSIEIVDQNEDRRALQQVAEEEPVVVEKEIVIFEADRIVSLVDHVEVLQLQLKRYR